MSDIQHPNGDLILTDLEEAALGMYGVLKVLPVVTRRIGNRMALPDVRRILADMHERMRRNSNGMD